MAPDLESLVHHDVLPDGKHVLMRLLSPNDAALYPEFVAHVTPEDSRLRFFSAIRELSDHAKESGLTGSPDIPEPPQDPRDLRSRWRSLRQSVRGTTTALPRVLRLVWETSRPLTIGLVPKTSSAILSRRPTTQPCR